MRPKLILNEEKVFNFDEMFFSTTDLSGRITSFNSVFERISAYTSEELINQPHSLIRHPDMPRAVFKILWDRLQSGKSVSAYVKNLAKDGKYYWVYALAFPIDKSYLSIRIKPSSQFLEIVQKLYSELLDYEALAESKGLRKVEVAEQSKSILLERLKSLGFDTYEDFMHASLPQEMISRDLKLNSNDSLATSHESKFHLVKKQLDLLAVELSKATDLNSNIKRDFNQVYELASEIRLGALNAVVQTSRMGNNRDSLFVLANYLERNGHITINELKTARLASNSSIKEINEILFYVYCAKLETEMLINFFNDSEQTSHVKFLVDRNDILVRCFSSGINEMKLRFMGVYSSFGNVLNNLENISRLFMGLSIAHVSAKAESGRITNGAKFAQIFEEVCSIVERGRKLIDQTSYELETYLSNLKNKKYLYEDISKTTSDALNQPRI